MTIIITGGAGFLGQMLTRALLDAREAGTAPITFERIVSVDLAPTPLEGEYVSSLVGDLSDPDFARLAVGDDVTAVYHLAAVLSGGSAQDFDLAARVNIDGTRNLLEAVRATGNQSRFIFTSSLAVFSGHMPARVPAHWAAQPDSTYGAFKAVGELLVNEYSRKGFVDARICRLPTISVRPGKPNSAASSFASGIIREPLAGIPAENPVPKETRMWLSSPATVVKNLVHALSLTPEQLGAWRVLNVPGISVTVADMLSALETVAGTKVRSLVTDAPDPAVMEIVCSWPGDFEVDDLLELGFVRDETFEDVVRQYIENS